MSYTEKSDEVFTYFTDEEKKKIETYLNKKGWEWETNNVCGSHCGMFEDEYWIADKGKNAIFSDLKKESVRLLASFIKRNKIDAEIRHGTLTAN